MNVNFDNGFVGIYFAYPPNSVFKQSIYTCFEEITKKVNNSQEIIDFYRDNLLKINVFEPAKSQLKWVISKKYPEDKTIEFIKTLKQVIEKIKQNGLKTDLN